MTACPTDTGPDPIARHVAALDRALRGPRTTLLGMLAEARDGMRDAAEAHRERGLSSDRAAELAVREFGTVEEVVPAFQAELTARQGRLAAVQVLLIFPGMLFGWDLLWSSGLVRWPPQPQRQSEVVRMLAGLQDGVTAVVGIAALALFAASFLRRVPPRGLSRAVGVTGAAGALVCGGLSTTMYLVDVDSSAELFATNAAAVGAITGSALVMALVVRLSVRTLRVAGQVRPG